MKAPKATKTYTLGIMNFNGIDLRNSLSKVSANRSPMCPNMIRETIGENRKRYGYRTLFSFDGRINGFHVLRGQTEGHMIVHAGEKIYSYEKQLSPTASVFDSDTYTGVYPASFTATETGNYLFTLKGGKGADSINSYDGKYAEGGKGGTIIFNADLNVGDTVVIDEITSTYGGTAYKVTVNSELYAVVGGGGQGAVWFRNKNGNITEGGYFKGADGGGGNGADGTGNIASFVGKGAAGNTAGAGGNGNPSGHSGSGEIGGAGGNNYTVAAGAGGNGYAGGGGGGCSQVFPSDYEYVCFNASGGGGSSFLLSAQNITETENSQGTSESARALVQLREWVDSTPLTSSANDDYSVSVQMNGKLYILDGANYWVYDGNTLTDVSDNAYVPTTTIAKTYEGGGTTLEPLNLLTGTRIERFTGDNSHKTFQLGSVDIDSLDEIQSLQADGTFVTLDAQTDYSVNLTNGTFTLTNYAPTPIVGSDNLYVKYTKEIDGYADKIKKCTICICYGMNGAKDRLFVSGNDEFRNYDWFSGANDPTYFADTNYSVVGQDDSAIVGYSLVNDYLVTHKDTNALKSNILLRSGEYTGGQVIFPFRGSYPGSGAIAKHSFAAFANEPLYVTSENRIDAITSADVLGEKISQERSYFISSALQEEDLTNAYGITHNGFYFLAVGDKLYILDSTQPVTERNSPYSHRQYEAYLWTGIGARVLLSYDGALWFGTEDGKIKRFGTKHDEVWTDDGYTEDVTVMVDGVPKTYKESYKCYWDTCEFYGAAPQMKKFFKHLTVALESYVHTGCRIWAQIDGVWIVLFDYDSSANYLDFNDIDFNDFTFRTDQTSTVVGGKMREKKLLHIQFRFENSRPQPFSLLWAVAEYTMGDEYRKQVGL